MNSISGGCVYRQGNVASVPMPHGGRVRGPVHGCYARVNGRGNAHGGLVLPTSGGVKIYGGLSAINLRQTVLRA